MLPQLPQDKANHALYGLLIYFIATVFTTPLAGFIVAIIVGALKELYDKLSKTGRPEVLDFVVTAAGAAAGYLCTTML